MEEQFEVRDLRNGDWYWVHKIIYEKYLEKIGTIGLSLYNALCYYSSKEGKSYPSVETLSKKLKITPPTAYKYLKILENNKLIRIERRKKDNLPNVYHLLKLLKEGGTPPKTALVHLLKEFNINNNNINNNTRITSNTRSDETIKPIYLYQLELKKLLESKQRIYHIIGLYWKNKNLNFDNKQKFDAALARERKAAKLLEGYNDEEILKTMNYLEECTDFKYTLETIHKYIDEDLNKLKSKSGIEEEVEIPEYAKK